MNTPTKHWSPAENRVWNPLRDFPRNMPCFCGSTTKFKRCCMSKLEDTIEPQQLAPLKAAMAKVIAAGGGAKGKATINLILAKS